MSEFPEIQIQRLILYRKILLNLKEEGVNNIYSHRLASLAGRSPAQVRRDLMPVGYSGTPVHGYNVDELSRSISNFLDRPQGQNVAIIGLGNLGRAILDYCNGKNSKLSIIAGFDKDANKINRIINHCECYHIDDLEKVIKERNIKVAILTISSDGAQPIVDRLIKAGVNGLLNYTSERLHLPERVFVENRDMMMALEKVAYFAQK